MLIRGDFMSLNPAYQLDELDLQILDLLIKDCRTPYLEIARICHVSGGTIHVRMKKMEELGIIKGTRILLNLPKLGYDVCCFVGIYVDKTSSFDSVFDELSRIKEVVELHLTTGNYSIFAKVVCRNISDLQNILLNKINSIGGIQRTDTIISLEQPIDRNITI
jgi:Lrp/AsnC family transcriptional regulator, regulator for asnA, asnC and gidA